MTKSKRLQSLVNLARNDENHAARALGECQKMLDEQAARLDELKSYRREYIGQIQRLSGMGLGIETVLRYRRFVERLDQTIAMQAGMVERIQGECEEKRRAWSAARVKHKSLDKAVARYRAAETRRRDRREQQLSDEFATGRYGSLNDDEG